MKTFLKKPGRVACVVMTILAGLLSLPGAAEEKGQADFAKCKSNLKELSRALEIWSDRHNGHYPPSLNGVLGGAYGNIKTMPICPAAGVDTYSAGYTPMNGADLSDCNFRIECRGHFHQDAGKGPNRPAYSSEEGALDK